MEEGPIPAVHGVVRWRGCDLIALLQEEFGISVSDDTVYRTLKALRFAHLSARPKAYRQDAEAAEAFKTYGPPRPQAVFAYDTCQSAATYPACGHRPGQDGDPHVPVLIKLTASERHF